MEFPLIWILASIVAFVAAESGAKTIEMKSEPGIVDVAGTLVVAVEDVAEEVVEEEEPAVELDVPVGAVGVFLQNTAKIKNKDSRIKTEKW